MKQNPFDCNWEKTWCKLDQTKKEFFWLTWLKTSGRSSLYMRLQIKFIRIQFYLHLSALLPCQRLKPFLNKIMIRWLSATPRILYSSDPYLAEMSVFIPEYLRKSHWLKLGCCPLLNQSLCLGKFDGVISLGPGQTPDSCAEDRFSSSRYPLIKNKISGSSQAGS